MRIFDMFSDGETDADGRIRNQPLPVRNARINEKEVISVEPDDVGQVPAGRPPIIFENGHQ